LGQNSGHYCSPNATYDRLVGISPSKCSRRDLFAELADRLAVDRIRSLAYLPSGAPAADLKAREKLGWRWGYETSWPNGYCDNLRTGERLETFQLNWGAVITEWSQRWGRRLWGWWIDGVYFADAMYRHPKPPNFESLTAALRAGNPEALVAFNPGPTHPMQSITEHEDYTAGEGSLTDLPLCQGRWVEYQHHAAQWHTYNWMSPLWGRGTPPRLDADLVVGYTRHVATNGGVVTWDAPVDARGVIRPEYFAILERLAREVPCERLPS
jgi:hypothetical protein